MDKHTSPDLWLDLAGAARYLGVHFTTLRRWADAGSIPCIRTPGGRRRFTLADLQHFVTQARSQPTPRLAALQATALDIARRHIHEQDIEQQAWLARLDAVSRHRLRANGQRMVALLMQYSARGDSGETFLEEGRRMAAEHGHVCCESGLSLHETARVFLFFRRSILDSVHETSGLTGPNDRDAQRLYHRMSDYLDAMLLATIDGFERTAAPRPLLWGNE